MTPRIHRKVGVYVPANQEAYRPFLPALFHVMTLQAPLGSLLSVQHILRFPENCTPAAEIAGKIRDATYRLPGSQVQATTLHLLKLGGYSCSCVQPYLRKLHVTTQDFPSEMSCHVLTAWNAYNMACKLHLALQHRASILT
jgi:hypothetical protein